jgi:hypothetical protein
MDGWMFSGCSQKMYPSVGEFCDITAQKISVRTSYISSHKLLRSIFFQVETSSFSTVLIARNTTQKVAFNMMSSTNDSNIRKEESENTEPEPEPTAKSFEVDEENPSKISDDEEDTRTKGFVVTVAMAAALGGLIFGYGECQ